MIGKYVQNRITFLIIEGENYLKIHTTSYPNSIKNMSADLQTSGLSVATITAISAFIGSSLGTFWKIYFDQSERSRKDNIEKKEIQYIELNLALHLSSFAKKSEERIFEIAEIISESEMYSKSPRTYSELEVNFPDETKWEKLPIKFVAELKLLIQNYKSTNQYIRLQFEQWADANDCYELDCQRLAFYALRTLEIAAKIFKELDAETAELSDLKLRLQGYIDEAVDNCNRSGNSQLLIPELSNRFRSSEKIKNTA